MTAGRMDPGGVWDLEDNEALDAVRQLIADLKPVTQNAAVS